MIILGLDGKVQAKVTQHLWPRSLQVNTKTIQLFMIHTSSSPVVLGASWLARQNPQFDKSARRFISWSLSCRNHPLWGQVSLSRRTALSEPVLTFNDSMISPPKISTVCLCLTPLLAHSIKLGFSRPLEHLTPDSDLSRRWVENPFQLLC